MASTQGDTRRRYVRRMFGRIAPRYDLLNRLMTFGQDRRWRRELISRLEPGPGAHILDLGAGTGDLAVDILQRHPDAIVVAADLTPEMIQHGRNRPEAAGVRWLIADAEHLPFQTNRFDAVVSGFLLRNLGDLAHSLKEQLRVLSQNGRWGALDTSPPPNNLLRPFIRAYLHLVIPVLGILFTGDREAYRYLPASTEAFLTPVDLVQELESAGFHRTTVIQRMFRTVALYIGHKR